MFVSPIRQFISVSFLVFHYFTFHYPALICQLIIKGNNWFIACYPGVVARELYWQVIVIQLLYNKNGFGKNLLNY